MIVWEKTGFWLLALLMAAALLLPPQGGMKALAGQEQSAWVWTEEHPKPSWWHWGAEYEPRGKPVRGGYLLAASAQYIGLMNPNHWPVNDWVAMTYFYEMLVYNDGNFRPTVRWLADSWEFTDSTTCVMKLRRGVKFHDGTDFNANTMKYQIDWINDPANGAWTRAWIEPIESVEVVDEYTLRWRFKRPWGSFLGIMANIPGYPISQKALEADVAVRESERLAKRIPTFERNLEREERKARDLAGEELSKQRARVDKVRQELEAMRAEHAELAAKARGHKITDVNPVGTGKFMLEEGVPGNYLKLKRNPNWWFGPTIGHPEMPYLDGILITVIPDPSVQLANLRAGKLHTIGVDPSQYNLVKNDRNLDIVVVLQNHQHGLRFNHRDGPCKDIRVRQAVSHAIDRKAIIAGVLFGLGVEASGPYNEGHWGKNPDLKPVRYDPELSRKLLAEAGFPGGLTLKGYMANWGVSMTLGEAYKNMLAQVGINWEIDFLDSAAISDRLRNVEYDLGGGSWSWIWDPDMQATGLYHPDGEFNYGRSHNEAVIELIEKARREVDQNERQKMYWEIERLLYENYEDVWVWYPLAVTAYRKNVLGWNTEMYLAGREGKWFSHNLWLKDGKP